MKFLIALIISLWASTTSELVLDRLIIWNVGQGLWSTIVSLDSCTHIDMGGEKINWKKLIAVCGSKSKNKATFTHWDLDHISFAEQASRRLSGFCISVPPRGPTTQERVKVFSRFTLCSNADAKNEADITEVNFPINVSSKKPNDHSRVFTGASALFPGDSTSKQERVWSRLLLPARLKYLVLGHHGSKTSTSVKLLKTLPYLRQAIASARKKRYGHPHRSVVENLRVKGIATLSTEQWNNIVIEIR